LDENYFAELVLDVVSELNQAYSTSGSSVPSARDHAAATIEVRTIAFTRVPEQIILPSNSRCLRSLKDGNYSYCSESDIAKHVGNLIEDILEYLGRLGEFSVKSEVGTFSVRPDFYVIMSSLGFPVGVIEVKKPGTDILKAPTVLGEVYDYLLALKNYFKIDHPFALLTSLKEWRVCWLPHSNDIASQEDELKSSRLNDAAAPSTPVRDVSSPPSNHSPEGLTPSKQRENAHQIQGCDDVESFNNFEPAHDREMCGTEVLLATTVGTIRTIVSAVNKMLQAKQERFGFLNQDLSQCTLMQLSESGLVWTHFKGELQWDRFPGNNCKKFVILEDLGHGAHGRVYLACASNGAVCVIKFRTSQVDAEQECKNWKSIYSEFDSMVQSIAFSVICFIVA
jgi:hypothetical protein